MFSRSCDKAIETGIGLKRLPVPNQCRWYQNYTRTFIRQLSLFNNPNHELQYVFRKKFISRNSNHINKIVLLIFRTKMKTYNF